MNARSQPELINALLWSENELIAIEYYWPIIEY